jgi:uncharacterized membrane protein
MTSTTDTPDLTAKPAGGDAPRPAASLSSGPSRSVRALGALRRTALRVALCPAVWLGLIAAIFYSFLAVQRVDQHIAGSYDYGVIFQVIHGWAFHFYPGEALQGPGQSEWGDHFAPILMVLAPLLWIHDTPAILGVAQAFAICSGGIPIYYAVRRLQGTTVATVAVVLYLTSVEVQGAIGFDIHENMFQPLLIGFAIERALAGRWTAASVFICINLLSYEDVGMMVFLFGLGAAWNRKWKHAAVLCVLGPCMVVLFTAVIVPDWGRDVANYQLRHFDYGSTLHAANAVQAIEQMIEHPVHLAHLMVDEAVKRETLFLLFAPLGFLCLLSPISLLSSTTIVLLMSSGVTSHWSWNYEFYLQVAPMLIIGAADGLNRLGRIIRRLWHWYARWEERELPAELAFVRRPWAWRAAAICCAFAALGYTWHVQTSPAVKPMLAAWQYVDGGDHRPAAEVAAINAMAAQVPSGRNVYVSNDLGTVLVAQDTEMIDAVHADYALFDTGSAWTPKNIAQGLEKLGFHEVGQDRDVYLYAR